MLRKYLPVSVVLVVFFSCSVGSGEVTIPKRALKNPKSMYRYGMKLLKNDDSEEARFVFKRLRFRFPISLYATLAKLRIADTHRKEEHFSTAASAYRDFYKEHPSHKMVLSGYVMWQIGYCNFRLGPGDFFIFPPAHEKDLSYTQNAYAIFNVFLKRYPKSIYRKKVKKYHRRALNMLAEHEHYVANFYLKKKRRKGTKLRLAYLVRNYPDAAITPRAAVTLGRLYVEDGEYTRAATIYKTVLKRYAGTGAAKRALAGLASLKGKKVK